MRRHAGRRVGLHLQHPLGLAQCPLVLLVGPHHIVEFHLEVALGRFQLAHVHARLFRVDFKLPLGSFQLALKLLDSRLIIGVYLAHNGSVRQVVLKLPVLSLIFGDVRALLGDLRLQRDDRARIFRRGRRDDDVPELQQLVLQLRVLLAQYPHLALVLLACFLELDRRIVRVLLELARELGQLGLVALRIRTGGLELRRRSDDVVARQSLIIGQQPVELGRHVRFVIAHDGLYIKALGKNGRGQTPVVRMKGCESRRVHVRE